MMDFRRLLLGAAALIVTAGVGTAQAQTAILRKVAPGSSIEISVNNGAAESTKSDTGGDVVVPIKTLFTGTGKLETDSLVLVALCESNVIKVLLLERGHSVPPEERGCVRRDMGGWFLVKPVSTLVVDVGGPSPTLLLRQGSFSLAPPRTWTPPTGLVVFAGGTLNATSNFKDVACGTLTECSSGGAELGFTAGASYWILPFVAAEAAYFRPKEFTASGSGDNFRFDSTLDAHIFTAVGKIGIPAGRTRPYGHIGGTYHRATLSTSQTMTNQTDAPTQTYSLETEGWAWTFGGGLEIWLTSGFGIYGELNRISAKGSAVETNVEGILDDRLTTVVVGARIKIGG
jgi:hypothetical protein